MAFFRSKELSSLSLFYLSSLINYSTAVILPFLIVYFRSLGFSFTKISLIVLILGLGTFFFEIPTGIFADLYGRKKSVLLGFFGLSIIFLLMSFVKSFILLLILWIFFSFFQTFISGSDSSWVVSNLLKLGLKDLQQTYFVKLEIIVSLGLFISPLLGMFILHYFSYVYLWLFASLGTFISGFILVFVPEKFIPSNSVKFISLKKTISDFIVHFKESTRFVFEKKPIFYFFLAEIFVVLMTLGDEAWQPLFVNLGGSVYQLGILYSLTALLSAGVPLLVRYFTDLNLKTVLIVSECFDALILISVLFLHKGMFWFVLIPFILFAMNNSLKKPLKDNYIHSQLNDSSRATIASYFSMIQGLFVALTGLVGGILLDILPLSVVIALGSVFVLGAVYFYLRL